MKNVVNYLDEYIDEDGIYENFLKIKKDKCNSKMKSNKKEINENENIIYNKTFKNKRKNKK